MRRVNIIPAATYSPVASTIGAEGLSFCVRNGNRRNSSAKTTGEKNE